MFFFVIALLISAKLIGQQVIKGRLVDTLQNSIPNAIVLLKVKASHAAIKYAVANKDGSFKIVFNKNDLDSIVLEINAVGFITLQETIKLNSNEIFVKKVLHYNYKQLPDVLIKTSNSIRVIGDTTFFKVDSFKTVFDHTLSDLLPKTSGFQVLENGKISYNGKPISRILLDNDDLIGKNYEQITLNLSIRSIDELQVIDNYTDPENITSNLINNLKETVLNLKFKKEFLLKLFGEVEIATGFNKFYDVKSQITLLHKKIKLLSINNFNSIGSLSSSNSNTKNTSLNNNLNQISEPALDIENNVFSQKEIGKLQRVNFINSNNAVNGSLAFFSRLSKKIIVKGNSQFFLDKANLGSSNINSFLPPYQNIIINNNKQEFRNNFKLINSFFATNFTTKNQFGLLFENQMTQNIAEGEGQLLAKKYSENVSQSFNKVYLKFFYAHIFNKSSFLTYDFQYNKQNVTGEYFNTRNFFDSLIFRNYANGHLGQEENQNLFNILSRVVYTKKIKHYSFSVQFANEFSKKKLMNSISLGNLPINMIRLSEDSLNNSNYTQNDFTIKLEHNYRINKNLRLNFSSNLLNRSYEFQNKISFNGKLVKLLHSLHSSLKFDSKNEVYVSAIVDNKTRGLNIAGYGFQIKGLTEIQNSIDTLIWKDDYSLSIGFNHLDLFKKKLLWFASLTVTNNPMIFIPTQTTGLSYSNSLYNITMTGNLNYMANFNIQKHTNNQKLKLTYSFWGNKTIQFNSVLNNQFNKISLYAISNSFQIDIKLKSEFSLLYKVNHYITFQKLANFGNNEFKPQQLTNKINLRFQPTKNSALNIDGTFITSVLQKNNRNHIVLLNFYFEKISGKIVYGTKCQNLLNFKSYSFSTYSNLFFSTTENDILPINFLLYLRFIF